MVASSAEAQLELALFNSKAQDYDRTDVFTFFTNAGLPAEIIFRLGELWTTTRVIGGKLIQIGKIIMLEIMYFAKNNKHVAIGIAIGAAIGALVNLVPFLGPLLAPLSIAIGALLGGVAGFRLDRGKKAGHWTVELTQDIIALAVKFFELLASIFKALEEKFEDLGKA